MKPIETQNSRKKDEYGYKSSFPSRLRGLLESRSVKQEELASYCNVRRQSISQWKNGETRPDVVSLTKIAEFFDVSLDYLCGLSNTERASQDIKDAAKTTGLSERAVKTLYEMSVCPEIEKPFRAIEFLLDSANNYRCALSIIDVIELFRQGGEYNA